MATREHGRIMTGGLRTYDPWLLGPSVIRHDTRLRGHDVLVDAARSELTVGEIETTHLEWAAHESMTELVAPKAACSSRRVSAVPCGALNACS
jgi:hypothetical protein